MTETAEAAPAAAPKKRSIFKKAAWQTAAKAEGEKEKDIFSHSNEFTDIIAEQARIRKMEKQAREEEKKRKAEEERDRKRRKISLEAEDCKLSNGKSRSSAGESKGNIKSPSKTPISPLSAERDLNSLAARYDSLTRSSGSRTIQKSTEIIDLGDSDSDIDDSLHRSPAKQSSISRLPSKPSPVEDVEEIQDPRLAELARKARERQSAKEAAQAASESASPAHGNPAAKAVDEGHIVQLLLESDIPNTRPLFVKIRTSDTIEKVRLAWCGQQKFSEEMTEKVFLTWKNNKVHGTTMIHRLGIKVDEFGYVTVEGDTNIYDPDEYPRIHLQAWTEELFQQMKREKAEEAAARRRAVETPKAVEEEPVAVAQPEPKKTRLILKAKGKEDFKISVHQDTTIGHLAAAYKEGRKIPKDQPVTLLFDGERLKTIDVIADTEIEDMDTIEVHFK